MLYELPMFLVLFCILIVHRVAVEEGLGTKRNRTQDYRELGNRQKRGRAAVLDSWLVEEESSSESSDGDS